jgi:hypothetical protein
MQNLFAIEEKRTSSKPSLARSNGRTSSSRETRIVALGSRLSYVRSSLNNRHPATGSARLKCAISGLMRRSMAILLDHLVGAGEQRPIDVGSTAAGRRDNGLRAVRLGVPKRIRKGEPQGGVHRLRGLNSSSNCDSFGTVSKCGASDGIVSQDALDPVYRCAPVSRVSKSSSKPAGTQK